MSGIKIKINSELIYSSLAEGMVSLPSTTPNPITEEMVKMPEINPAMPILLWNTRGVERQGFRRNLNQLFRDHDPMFVILTETKVARPNIY